MFATDELGRRFVRARKFVGIIALLAGVGFTLGVSGIAATGAVPGATQDAEQTARANHELALDRLAGLGLNWFGRYY